MSNMEPKTFLFVLFSLVLSDMGITATAHFDHSSSPVLLNLVMTSDPNKNITGVNVPEELQKNKELIPGLRNYRRRTSSLEKRTQHGKSEYKVQAEMNKYQYTFTEKSRSEFVNFNQDTTLSSKNNVNAKNVITAIMINKNSALIDNTTNKAFSQNKTVITHKKEENKIVNNKMLSYTFNKTSDDINVYTLSQPRFHQPTNVTMTKNVHAPFLSEKDLPENTTYRKSEPVSVEIISSYQKTHQYSNRSSTNGTECCEGKDSQITNELDKEYPTRFDKEIMEEEKLNKYIARHLSDKTKLSTNHSTLVDINKQKNEFLEIKLLILSHLQSLNIKQEVEAQNGNKSLMETVIRSHNLFELTENLDKIFKILLESNEKNEDPSTLIRTVVEKQIKKCNEKYNKLKNEIKKNNMTLATVENNKGIMNFIECVSIHFKKCVRNFGLWLKTREFYLRPWFNLTRAYETYERIYDFSCN